MKQNALNKKQITPILAAIFLTALFMKNPPLATSGVKLGMERCLSTLIPSLFPFMVLSGILVECNVLSLLNTLWGKKSEYIFGLSGKAFSAVVSGLIFGFPIGTVALIGLCDRNEISKDELRHAIGFCGIPSFGFTVNVVGYSLFSDRDFGVFLYFSSLISALLVGAVTRPEKNAIEKLSTVVKKQIKSIPEIITSSVYSSSKSILTLCAYVVLFSCISESVLAVFDVHGLFSALIGGLLELTCGVSESSGLVGIQKFILCGFALGWSGLSVHIQTMAFVGNRAENFSKYFLQKSLMALLCAASSIFFFLLR